VRRETAVESIVFDTKLKAPFTYIGSKKKVADIVWKYLGDVKYYVEPFFGSGAVLL
jgi:site-specific DNA-adenine methylase